MTTKENLIFDLFLGSVDYAQLQVGTSLTSQFFQIKTLAYEVMAWMFYFAHPWGSELG